jgi:predicted nucleotidyltransferase
MKTLDSWTGKTADTELLRRCKEAITDVVPDATVILYGSRARGDAGEYSDYDIMVIVNQTVNMALKEKILDNIFPIELETGAVLTYIVYNKAKWDSPLYQVIPLHKNIDREGVIL